MVICKTRCNCGAEIVWEGAVTEIHPCPVCSSGPVKRNKYGNKKTEVDGIVFDSIKEAGRYVFLRAWQKLGEISDLETQPPYDCVVNGVKVCRFSPDFRYRTKEGDVVVEDVKSEGTRRHPVYRLKKKLLEALHGVKIVEV